MTDTVRPMDGCYVCHVQRQGMARPGSLNRHGGSWDAGRLPGELELAVFVEFGPFKPGSEP